MRNVKYILLLAVVVVIGLLHLFTPGYLTFYHDTYRRLSYFPIALGGIWFGVRGGLTLAALTSLAFIPHLLLFFGQEPATYLSELTEILLYLAAGGFIGIIAGKESRLRIKYQQLSEKLQASYQRLHEETQLLVEVEEELRVSQKLSTLGKLSASLAHEIKNPLGSIKGTAEILLDDYPAGHPKREFVEILLTESARLDASVNEVLHLFRGQTAADADVEREPLGRVLAHVVSLLRGELGKKRITLSVGDTAAVESFPVDGTKIAQILINLMLNALEALPPGGQIAVDGTGDDRGIRLRVRDNGPGVPPAVKAKLFQPFVTSKEDGAGLGLSISRKIAISYGGDLRLLDSAQGACFEIFLPHAPPAKFDAPKAPDAGPRRDER